jgi:hypothetical protein
MATDPNTVYKEAGFNQTPQVGDKLEMDGVNYVATKGEDGQTTFVSADSNGDPATSESGSTDKKNTPPKWSGPKDARELTGAGKYPNYYAHKTRSGHVLLMDDSKGAEHVTLQHRSGSMVQFHPDGKVAITAQNGQYTFTFGENRVKITGAYDITVDGAASMKVDGDYNLTVGKNMNIAVKGDLNVAAKNFNQNMIGNVDIAAKNMTTKLEGSSAITAKGSMGLTSKGGFVAGSVDDSSTLYAGKQMALLADTDEMMIRSGKKMSFESATGDIAVQTLTGAFSVVAFKGVMTFETSATIETTTDLQLISTGFASLKAGGKVSLLGGALGVSIGGLGPVGIAAVGTVGITGTTSMAITAPLVGLNATAALGLNATNITSTGIIQHNGAVLVVAAVPVVPIPPVPEIPTLASNPKLEFNVSSAETADTVDV